MDRSPFDGRLSQLALLFVVLALTSGCSAIAGIFKAGVWVGFVAAIVLVVLVLIVFGRLKR